MIISDEYKYVFIGLPLAASTAISKELCEMYSGRPILSKHSIYQDFLKVATAEQKGYKVLACARNPLDIGVSQYTKMMSNANGNYSNQQLLRKNGGHMKISEYKLAKKFWGNNGTFTDFLNEFYKVPFDNWLSITASHCDFVMRFDHLQEDFEQALKVCDIIPKRVLPVVNKTTKKTKYIDFYSEDNFAKANAIFGPYMLKHKIDFPSKWTNRSVPFLSRFSFTIMGVIRKYYWLHKSYRDVNPQKVYKELLEKHQ